VTHTIEGVPVRVYSAAKTIADCFKYRHKIGIDVAIEALRTRSDTSVRPLMKFTDSRKCVASTGSCDRISKRSYEGEDSQEHCGIASGKAAQSGSGTW